METVTRRVVLAKKADKIKAVEDMLLAHAGEVDRQLAGTRIAACAEDRDVIVDDYPLLPVRRRFWEHALRGVDVPGTASQLRTQLKIVHEAVRQTAERRWALLYRQTLSFNNFTRTCYAAASCCGRSTKRSATSTTKPAKAGLLSVFAALYS